MLTIKFSILTHYCVLVYKVIAHTLCKTAHTLGPGYQLPPMPLTLPASPPTQPCVPFNSACTLTAKQLLCTFL